MEQNEHDEKKEIINSKLQVLATEIAKLTGEIMNLEQAPFVAVFTEVVNVMGVCSVSLHVKMPKDMADDLNNLEKSTEKVQAPEEQVDELLKQMRSKNN